MAVTLKKFVRKPFAVEAIEVTADNMAELSEWCGGELLVQPGRGPLQRRRYIQVPVKRPLDERQSEAHVGDYLVVASDPRIKGFKVYTPKAFTQSFDELVADMEDVLGNMARRAEEEENYEEQGLGFAEELRQASKNSA